MFSSPAFTVCCFDFSPGCQRFARHFLRGSGGFCFCRKMWRLERPRQYLPRYNTFVIRTLSGDGEDRLCSLACTPGVKSKQYSAVHIIGENAPSARQELLLDFGADCALNFLHHAGCLSAAGRPCVFLFVLMIYIVVGVLTDWLLLYEAFFFLSRFGFRALFIEKSCTVRYSFDLQVIGPRLPN